MARKKGRRRFGNVRELGSGRFQARYLGPDGIMRKAPHTFDSKSAAEQWLTLTEAEILRGDWLDPLVGEVLLGDFGRQWIIDRKIRPTTRELYEVLFRLHIAPFVGDRSVGAITPQVVRTWRSALLTNGRSEITTAKAYRLLRAMMATAADDGLIRRNPCRIKGADQEHSPERPVATIPQVFALADAVPSTFRALILAAAFTGLRWGELIALRRADVDLDARTLSVARRLAELDDGTFHLGPTKSTAGFRTVAIPSVLLPELRRHLADLVGSHPEALIFKGEKGAQLRRSNFRRAVRWSDAIKAAGLPAGFRFHDLRHTGNHLAAQAGATTRELMHRMGHGSMRAALIYQHATSERDREIADRLSALIEGHQHQASTDEDDDGTAGVLVPAG
jgi:integrase